MRGTRSYPSSARAVSHAHRNLHLPRTIIAMGVLHHLRAHACSRDNLEAKEVSLIPTGNDSPARLKFTSWEDAKGLHTETPHTARVRVTRFPAAYARAGNPPDMWGRQLAGKDGGPSRDEQVVFGRACLMMASSYVRPQGVSLFQ